MKKYLSIFLIVYILVFSLWSRIFLLDTIPNNVTADEGDNIRHFMALSNRPFNIYSFNWNGSSALNSYILGEMWTLGGHSFSAIKYASIIMSLITLMLFFYIVYVQMKINAYLSTLLTLALSFNVAFLNFSRSGWENIYNSIPTLLLSFLFCQEKPRPTKGNFLIFVLAEVSSFYFYHPGKILLVTGFLWFAYSLLSNKTENSKTKLNFLLLSIVGILIPISFGIYAIVANQNQALNRIQSVSLFNDPNAAFLFQQNVVSSIKAIFYWTNNNLRYGNSGTVLSIPTLVIFILALPFVWLKYRKVLLFFIANFLIIQIFSRDTPDLARGIHLVPLMYLCIAAGLNTALSFCVSSLKMRRVLILITTLILSYSVITGMRDYIQFITTSNTMAERKPSVMRNEYTEWKTTIEKNPPGMSLGEWELYIRSRNSSGISPNKRMIEIQ